ncbi:MAG: discoidin domain-containing protein [Pirellulaceae bacterium]
MRSPSLNIMTGFIYEPLKPYTIEQWMDGLGSRFDADRWVQDFQEVGANYMIFYDKWIDGLVFHDTKTTSFKTQRDFVRALSAACQRHGLRLVFYFNAISDGNPEFDKWALVDRQGKPVVFSPNWPTRYQTLHSPFRQKAIEQVRELLTGYGRVDGIWHDIFFERLDSANRWMAGGYEKIYGEPMDSASPERLAEFQARTLADYLDEVAAIRQQAGQDSCLFTANGAGASFLASNVWTRQVGARLQYLFDEGHSFERNDALARMAWVLPKPMEVNFLLNSSWFTPLEDAPPPSHLSEKQAIAGSAIAICQGASVNFALTPGHAGEFGEDLQRAKAVGAWLRRVQPFVTAAQPYADLGMVLGTPPVDGQGFPAVAWAKPLGSMRSAPDQAFALADAVFRAGMPSRVLYAWEGQGSWPKSLASYAAIMVPEQAPLDEEHADQLRHYVRDGGTLVAFGKASLRHGAGESSDDFALGDLFGVQYRGELTIAAERTGASVKVDSEYSPEFAAEHLLDELPTAWASGGGPMPHWVEITLPQPVEVHQLELINRVGPYQVTDVDVEWADGATWRAAASVVGASSRTIVLPFDTAVRTDRIRVTIRRELFEGKDRTYADVESIRILDGAGHNWAFSAAPSVAVEFTAADVKQAFAAPLEMTPWAAAIVPTEAEVVARFAMADAPPAITRHRLGRGQAIYVAMSDQGLRDNRLWWAGLRQLILGEPTISLDGEHVDRFRCILTRVDGAHVLHVVDSAVPYTDYQPQEVTVSLHAGRLGDPRHAVVVESNTSLAISRQGDRIAVKVRPDPVASVVLK